MPSRLHEVLVELFRQCGELAPALLRIAAQVELDHARAEVAANDLSQVMPTEYRADAVAKLYAETGELTAAVIVEIQLRVDDDKRFTWPLYLTALRAKLRCPVFLLVVTPSRAVATWARQPIEIGQLGFALQPIVMAFDELPKIVDAEVAARLPELAVLSAMAHPDLQVLKTAITALDRLRRDEKQLYLDLILSRLSGVLRRDAEDLMIKDYEFQSDFARRHIKYGRDEGLKVGRDEGLKVGRDEGLQTAVLALARDKLGNISEHEQASIAALADEGVLLGLISALGMAGSASEARAVLDAAITAR